MLNRVLHLNIEKSLNIEMDLIIGPEMENNIVTKESSRSQPTCQNAPR